MLFSPPVGIGLPYESFQVYCVFRCFPVVLSFVLFNLLSTSMSTLPIMKSNSAEAVIEASTSCFF